MADKIIVEYELNIDGFNASVQEAEKGYSDLASAAKGAQSSTQSLSGSVGTLTDKFEDLSQAEKDAATQAAQLNSSQAAAARQSSTLGTAIDKVKTSLSGAATGFANLARSAAAGVSGAVKGVGGLSGAAAKLGGSFTNAGGAVGRVFKTLGGQVTNFASQLPVVGQFAAALGPVGIGAAAVAGGLLAIVNNTDAGATALDGLGRTGGLIFDRVTGVAKDFFNTLTSGTGFIGTAFDGLSAAVDFFVNKLTPIGAIVEAIGSTSFFQGIKEDFKEGQRIAGIFDDLDQKQRDSIGTLATLDAEYRKLNVQLRDRTKTDEERLAIADQLTAAEDKRAGIEQDILKATTAAIQQEVDAAKARNEASDELSRKLEDAKAAEIAASAASVERLEKAENRKNAIIEGGIAKQEAARQKAAAAAEKRDQEAAKRLEQRAQAEARLAGIVDQVAAEALDRTLSEGEREVEATKRKYADLIAQAQEAGKALTEASDPSERAAAEAQSNAVILQLRQAQADELNTLAASEREEALEQLRKYTMTSTELEREAALQRFDELSQLAEQNIANEEERAAVIAELRRKAEEELTGIVTEEEQKRIDAQKAAVEQAVQLEEQRKQVQIELQQAQVDAAAKGVEIITQLAGETEEAQAVALVAQKAAAVANVVIQTQAAIAAANAALLAIPPLLPPGIPNPAFPAAVALNAAQIAKAKIQAGISIATILAQSIAGAYTGEERVGRGEAPQLPGTRDRYLRRVHKDEGIVDARTNMEHLDAINAMRRGTFDSWVASNYAPLIGDDDRMVRYVNSDMGARMAQSITLPRMFDKGIVGGIARSRKEQQLTNELSALVANTSRRRTNPRYS
jgi:hypothetical protein